MAEEKTPREWCEDGLRSLDPELEKTDPTWPVAAMLLLSLRDEIGAREALIAEYLELDEDFAAAVAGRFRSNGIWDGEKVATAPDYDGEHGGIAFWMDVSVGDGRMQRHPDGRYSMTPEGKAYVESKLL